MKPDADRRLIFHIGQHKTGSTAIQDALARGEIRPEGRRILYTTRMHHNYLPKHFNAWANDGTTLPGSETEPGLDALSERLARGDFDDAVFSAENFEGMDAWKIRRVLERFFLPHVRDHRILCWVRPHAARTVSDFAENIKIGWFDGDLEAFHDRFLHERVLSYAERLADLRDCFGDRFHARVMLRELLADNSILHDFAEAAFGPGADVAITAPPTANETLPLEDLVMLRHLQGALADRNMHLRHAFGWEMMHILQSRPRKGTRLTMHRSLAERVRKDYLEDARALDRGIFAATPVFERELDRTVDEAVAEPQSLDPRDHFNPARLRQIEVMADIILTLLGNNGQPWQPYLVRCRINRLHGNAASAAHRRRGPKRQQERKADGGRNGEAAT